MPSVRLQELAGRLGTLNRRYRVGFYGVVLLNLLVILAYAWGQDGQTVTVEVTNDGRFYEASVDGRKLPTRFNLDVPASCPGVPADVLKPRSTWTNPAEYDAQALKLAKMFIDNFKAFEAEVGADVRAAGPQA